LRSAPEATGAAASPAAGAAAAPSTPAAAAHTGAGGATPARADVRTAAAQLGLSADQRATVRRTLSGTHGFCDAALACGMDGAR
jgi:hypothetical protein